MEVLHDPDHAQLLVHAVAGCIERLGQGIVPTEGLHRALVHHHGALCVGGHLRVEHAPFHQLKPDQLREVGVARHHRHRLVHLALRGLHAQHPAASPLARHGPGEGGPLHEVFPHQLGLHRAQGRPLERVVRRRLWHGHGQQLVLAEAHVGGAQPVQLGEHHQGAHAHEEGDGELEAHEHLPHPLFSGGGGHTLLQQQLRGEAGKEEGGIAAGQDAHHEQHQEQHAHEAPGKEPAGIDVLAAQFAEGRQGQHHQQERYADREQGHQGAATDELRHELFLPCAGHFAQGHFLGAPGGACRAHVDEVDAGDEQDQHGHHGQQGHVGAVPLLRRVIDQRVVEVDVLQRFQVEADAAVEAHALPAGEHVLRHEGVHLLLEGHRVRTLAEDQVAEAVVVPPVVAERLLRRRRQALHAQEHAQGYVRVDRIGIDDAGDPEAAPVALHQLPDRIGIAEHACGQLVGDHQVVRCIERLRTSVLPREVERAEEGGVGIVPVLRYVGPPLVLQGHLPELHQLGAALELGVLAHQGADRGERRDAEVVVRVAEHVVRLDAVDPIGLGMMRIEAQFVLHVDPDQQAGGDADGEPPDVEECEERIALQGAPGDQEVFTQHGAGR